ncbi:hypothetical protein JHK82_024697 [Glycine max]|uniref:Uncharacterized protein n=2 Tax=Glycine subgen. Soja TaxID=1462606 RepID=A0A0R0IGM6_SOYBN|nr:hypothetical protein JHK87_024658 [Glycine soja]KAG5006757.1 hypothetical protein JHK85_025299 [Glycine max]KAG5012550.1 hypothetical protein JHK86_024811 [Glycine max]KAG5133509.1 hypothetical protein JHK82_024697 [Glycine max]KAH1042483.1 hypothetical protein GYH30_024670 [Glycine max]
MIEANDNDLRNSIEANDKYSTKSLDMNPYKMYLDYNKFFITTKELHILLDKVVLRQESSSCDNRQAKQAYKRKSNW